jgi:RimJ/RimL family protein N-acetyltransferase
VLETPRLILRPFKESDVEAAHVWFSDPEIFRFYTYGPYRSLEETANRICEYRLQFEKHGFGKCIVVDKATGIPIGDAGLMLDEDHAEVHVGYKIARSHWGRGLATEAAREWVKHGFDNLGLARIAAFIHPQNAASIRVVEKLQFSLCTHRREAEIDWNIYELLKAPQQPLRWLAVALSPRTTEKDRFLAEKVVFPFAILSVPSG